MIEGDQSPTKSEVECKGINVGGTVEIEEEHTMISMRFVWVLNPILKIKEPLEKGNHGFIRILS